ncbi:MAG: nucleoside deaminase [Planctomycetaceae bacterium]
MTESQLEHELHWSLPAGWESLLPKEALTGDQARMNFVVGLARWNIRNRTGGPFAAAVFERGSGRLAAVGVNRAVPLTSSMAHAEALAIGLAQKRFRTHDLSSVSGTGFELVTSGQPCIQCFGMVWWSGVTRLVVGARAADIEEICGFDEGPIPADWKSQLENRDRLPAVEVLLDVCRDEACAALQMYADMNGPNYSPGHS